MTEDRIQRSDIRPLDAALDLLKEFLEDALQTGRNSHGPSNDFREVWKDEDPEMFALVERAEVFLRSMDVDWHLPIDITEREQRENTP